MKKITVLLFAFFVPSSLASTDLENRKEKSALREYKNAKQNSLSRFSLLLKNSLEVQKNDLLKNPYNWSTDIPYTGVETEFYFSEDSFFSAEIGFAFQNEDWKFYVDGLFIQKSSLLFPSVSWKAGYFPYSVSYAEENETVFSRGILTHQNLFPFRERALGIALKGTFIQNFYWQLALQSPLAKRETDQLKKWKTNPALSVSGIYEQNKQKAFLSYFKQDFFLEGSSQAIGWGSDFSYSIKNWNLSFKKELWGLQRNKPSRHLLSYYFYPSFRYHSFSFGMLFGQTHYYLKKSQSLSWEYILKANYFITDHIWLSLEKFKEGDSIIKESGWSLSLKSQFQME